MARCRMIATDVIDRDGFVELSPSAQMLYVRIIVKADDDGLIDSSRQLMMSCGASEDDFKSLIDSGFILSLGDGVYAITDWLIQNKIPPSKHTETVHQEKFNLLVVKNGGQYALADDSPADTQNAAALCSPLAQPPCATDLGSALVQPPCATDLGSPLVQPPCATDLGSPLVQPPCATDLGSPLVQPPYATDLGSIREEKGREEKGGEEKVNKENIREENIKEENIKETKEEKENNKESNSKYYNSVIEKYNSLCKDLPEVRKSSII